MKLFVGGLLCGLMALPGSAAVLLGQTVQTTYLFPNTSTVFAGPVNSVVGPGVELVNFAGFVDIDFSDTNVLITADRNAVINNVPFDGLRFVDVNGTVPPVNVTVDPATNYAGFTASRVTFGTNSVFVNLEGLPGLVGQKISLDFTPATASPEPGSFVLVGALLGILVLYRRVAPRARALQ